MIILSALTLQPANLNLPQAAFNLSAILPQIILVAAALLLLMVDLVLKNKRTLPWLSLLAILAALAATVYQWLRTQPSTVETLDATSLQPAAFIFQSSTADALGIFAAGLILIAAALANLLALERTADFTAWNGKADELLPILIELGFSAFHGVEKAANDLADIKARFGKDITLVGNMDVVFLTHSSPAGIRAETEAMLRIGSQGGCYMAACNTSPMHYIPFDNYMAMVETIHAF